jgi:hypothetical protein
MAVESVLNEVAEKTFFDIDSNLPEGADRP